MEKYAAKFMELAPRDIVSRSEMTEILEGRGFEGPDGLDYIHLDLTHLGAERINKRLPLIREVCMKFLGLDPITTPVPIRPVAHYSMGGVEADINGRTKVENIWAAGEVACHSLHGANRLGCNSTAECLAWGGITGKEIAKYMATGPKLADAEGVGGQGRGEARLRRHPPAEGRGEPLQDPPGAPDPDGQARRRVPRRASPCRRAWRRSRPCRSASPTFPSRTRAASTTPT